MVRMRTSLRTLRTLYKLRTCAPPRPWRGGAHGAQIPRTCAPFMRTSRGFTLEAPEVRTVRMRTSMRTQCAPPMRTPFRHT